LIAAALGTLFTAFIRVKRSYLLTVVPLALALLIGVDAALCYSTMNGSNRAVITGETIARKGTGNSYEPAFDQPLRDGAEFQILTETPDWTFGHFESIGDGWVRNEFVAK
jgi:hypothetical protein